MYNIKFVVVRTCMMYGHNKYCMIFIIFIENKTEVILYKTACFHSLPSFLHKFDSF